jgi:hypothetical protein
MNFGKQVICSNRKSKNHKNSHQIKVKANAKVRYQVITMQLMSVFVHRNVKKFEWIGEILFFFGKSKLKSNKIIFIFTSLKISMDGKI